jgi:hypothetical protein
MQDEALKQLIRSFSLLLHELREGASRQAASDRYPESLMIAARHPTERGSDNNLVSRSVIHGRTNVSSKKLRRACRIALMESDEARVNRRNLLPHFAQGIIPIQASRTCQDGDRSNPGYHGQRRQTVQPQQ